MKAVGTLVCVLAGALVWVGGLQAAGADGCKNLHATGLGQDLGGGNTTATISHAGFLPRGR